jgi:hypothetical protein
VLELEIKFNFEPELELVCKFKELEPKLETINGFEFELDPELEFKIVLELKIGLELEIKLLLKIELELKPKFDPEFDVSLIKEFDVNTPVEIEFMLLLKMLDPRFIEL